MSTRYLVTYVVPELGYPRQEFTADAATHGIAVGIVRTLKREGALIVRVRRDTTAYLTDAELVA